MLPTTRPDRKNLTIFTSPDQQQQQPEAEAARTTTTSPIAVNKRRVHLLRDGLILLVSMILAVAFIVWGPKGDFLAGRAFTVTTTNEVTYIYYNWTVQLPLDTPKLNMQAWNNRLVGSVTFMPAPAQDKHYTISIETTAAGRMFTITPWTMGQTQQSGFGIVVSDLLPNVWGIDYANVVVYIPSHRNYSELVWNTYPPATAYASLPGRKWNVHFEGLTQAGIYYDKFRVKTDGGSITSTGIHAAEGWLTTVHGDIDGVFNVPDGYLHTDTNGNGE
ncbi:hypothetical protein FRC17_005985 [Serendipita sp. 399]|nr:hypothetical protein FRC17_005985 [Serendipita sp. 399]